MQYVRSYVKENRKELEEIFASMGSDGVIQATKVYAFLQSAFDTQEFKFMQNGKSYFNVEQNADKMERLIEDYYLANNQGETKFYMYRVNFEFEEVINIIKFWLKRDPSIQIFYKDITDEPVAKPKNDQKQNQQQNETIEDKKQPKHQEDGQQKSDNQFMPQLSQIPAIILKYRSQISKYQERIKAQQLNEKEIKSIKDKIKELETKITFLEERLREKSPVQSDKNHKNQQKVQPQREKSKSDKQKPSISPSKQLKSRQISPQKIESTLKSIFQFYAKQLHVTGVKASFQRIEHESSRINYQKLVHFLKEYEIFPPEIKDQKKLHHFYVKCSSNTRDLTYEGFLMVLQRLAEIVVSDKGQHQNGQKKMTKFGQLKLRIIQKRRRNKTLNNPFHSLEKQDFRIDKAQLKYEFKLLPLNGKDPQQITTQLEVRKQNKQEKIKERQNIELRKKIRYLKKLQSIDPFHPMVERNKHLIREKTARNEEVVVSVDNLQIFRDKSFDLKMLGIEDDALPSERYLGRNKSDKQDNRQNRSVTSNNSYMIKDRVREVEKIQVEKMKSLMSGIIERSNAKMEKLGISPMKRSINMY